MAIKTQSVAERREVHYESLEEVLSDAERLARGKHRTVGNWSFGQIMGHLAETCHMSIDGSRVPVPWFVRCIGRLFRKRVLRKKMGAGFQLPPAAAAVLVPSAMSVEDGLAALRRGIERLRTESKRSAHSVFGPYSIEEWNQLHLRHAELHMSFVLPEEPRA